MNEEKTSANISESTKKNKSKKLGLFIKKDKKGDKVQHSNVADSSSFHNSVHSNHSTTKPKNSLNNKLGATAKWIKKNSLISISVAVLVVLIISAVVIYNFNRPQSKVLSSNNQVISEYKSKLPELQKSVSANNNSATAHKNYAVALYVTGNYEAAKNEYEAAVKIDGKDSTTYNNLGNTYRDLGKYDKAKTAYEKAFEINPTSINPYVNLANIQLYTQNNSNAATDTYKKALKAMPDNAQISLLLGIAYEKAGKTTEAKQTYQDILAKNAEDKAAKAGLDRLNK